MNNKLIVIISAIGITFILGLTLLASSISFSNDEISLTNQFKQKMDERTAFYDKMWKTLSGKSQVALKNDSAFARNVDAIMTNRKDAPQVFMKWVQESNPNANFDAVSKLYEDLSRAIEGQRDGFFMEEKMIQGVVLEHNNLVQKWPGSMWNSMFYKRPILTYKPITSDRTDDAISTGKDNNAKMF